jgi:hypothetical protein
LHFVNALYSTVVFWCLSPLHVVFAPWSSAGLRVPSLHPPPLNCCVMDLSVYESYIALSVFFLSTTLLILIFSCVSLPHLLELFLSRIVSLQSCTDHHNPLPPATCINPIAGTTLLTTYQVPHSSLFKLRIGTAVFLFRFLSLEDGTDRLSLLFLDITRDFVIYVPV